MIQIIAICIFILVIAFVLTSMGVPAAAALPVAAVGIVIAIGIGIAVSVSKDKDYKETTLNANDSFLAEKLGPNRTFIGEIECCAFYKGQNDTFAYVVTDRGMGAQLDGRSGSDSNIILGSAAYCVLSSGQGWKLEITTGYSRRIESKKDMTIAAMASLMGAGLIVGPSSSCYGDNCITGVVIEIFGFGSRRFLIPMLQGEYEINHDTKYKIEKIEKDFDAMISSNYSPLIQHYQMELFEK